MAVTPQRELVPVERPGLVLRAFRPEDVALLAAALADVEIARWNPGPDGPEPARAFMEERNDWGEGGHASWAVADPVEGLVGSVSVFRIDAAQADAEDGFWIAPWARGRGYAARPVVTASGVAFGTVGLHRLYLHHAVENPASCGVARAAGFPWEGTLRESYRYPDGAYHDEHLHGRLRTDDVP